MKTFAFRTRVWMLVAFSFYAICTQAVNVINVPAAGQLSSVLTQEQKDTITDLKLTGFLNSNDCSTLRDNMPQLRYLDILDVTITSNTLPSNAFYYNSSLKKIVLPANLLTINDYAFYYSTSLSQVVFPEGLQTIGYAGFYNCTSLSGELALPSSLTNIGGSAFYNCHGLTVCKISAITPPTLSSYSLGDIAVVFVPAASVASYKNADYWKEKIIIGDQIASITLNITTPGTLGEMVLESFNSLTEVNELIVSGTLNSTDFNHIKSMTALLSVDLSGCTNEELPNELFYNRPALSEVKLPANLKRIGSYCFYNCYALQSPDFPASLEEIANYAFYYCYNLHDLSFDSVKYIRGYAFYNCSNIASVNLSNSLLTLEDGVFYGCTNISELVIPNSVTTIGGSAFSGCTALTTVSIPDHITTINYSTFRDCTSLTNIQLPSKLTTLGEQAFYNCKKLTHITLPAGLTNMSSYYSNSYGAFYNCTGLEQITCLQATPPVLNYDPFSGVNKSTCELVIPFWAETQYKLADYWKDFANINTYNQEIENIIINGSLVLTNNARPLGLPNVDITSSGSLSVRGNAPFNTNAFILRPQLRYYWDQTTYPQLISECNAMSAQQVKMDLSAYGGMWYYLSFPFDVPVSSITIDNGAYYVFRRYDGESRATQGVGDSWKNVAVNDTLRAGAGYIFQCSKDISHLALMATSESKNDLFQSTAKMVPLNEYSSENAANKNWNLVGNPFPSYYDIRCLDYTAPITHWNDNYSRYEAVSPVDDAFLIKPYQAFFVQKPNDLAAITFNTAGRQTTTELVQRAPALRSSNERTLINLEINNSEFGDKARVVVNPEAKLEYEMERDAAKFMSTDPAVPQLYSLDQSLTQYAINERPLDGGIVPLGFYAGATDNYTISLANLPNNFSASLQDKYLDILTDLILTGYSFRSETGTFNDRFELYLNMEQGVTAIGSTLSSTVKIYTSGRQIIVESAQTGQIVSVYSVAGAKITETKITSDKTSIPVTQGIYIIKMDKEVFKTVVF